MQNDDELNGLCERLEQFQRERSAALAGRIAQENFLQAKVAAVLGYRASMPEAERTKFFDEASAVITAVHTGQRDGPLPGLITAMKMGIDALDEQVRGIEKQMLKVVKQLPVAEWVASAEQRGFGLPMLAIVIGETGNLSRYANPAKLWKRLGCAPFEFKGKCLMGATWKSGKEGKLGAKQWSQFGYSPRRRSVSFLVGKFLMMQNKGEYRERYESAKLKIAELHPDYSKMRCDRHGMLLATKRLLLNLWKEWNNHGADGLDFDTETARVRAVV